MFPFLAVLLCTMGALIVLLVVIAQQARQHALASAPPHVDEQLQFQLETARWRMEVLKESREKTAAQLADARGELSHLEDHGRRLRDELRQIAGEISALDDNKQLDAGQRDGWQRRLAELDEAILDARGQLNREVARQQRSSYAIVPYQGPNETHRRPIYIECRADTIVLQPEGMVLQASDFPDIMGPSNPLAAVVRAATESINTRRFERGAPLPESDVGQPYPLLLVRPDGIAAYYAARAALASWDQEFGYELIEQDWQLEFPPADPQLQQAMQLALDEARQRQELRLAAAPNAARGQQSFRVARTRGGMFVEEDALRGGGGGDGYGYRGNFRDSSGGGFQGRFARDQDSEPSNATRYTGRYEHGGGGVGHAPSQANRSPYDAPIGATGNASTATSAGGGSVTPPASAFASNGAPTGNSEATSGQQSGTGGTGNHRTGQQAAMMGTAGATGAGDGAQRQAGGPSLGASFGDNASPDNSASATQRPGELQSMASTRGENWGLPRASRGSVPVTRPIRIECMAGRLRLHDDNGGRSPQDIPLGFRTESSVDELVSAVWTCIDRWGIAGQGMYWRPVLAFEVRPGGEERFRDLEVLLAGSGLLVESQAATPTAPARY